MNKTIATVILLTLTVSLLAGCGSQPAASTVYTDGTYFAVSDANDHGYATAEVTVKADKITEVKLNEITELAVAKDYATYPYPVSAEANAALPAKFVEANSAEIDIYTGATHSSESYMQAVARALEKAKTTKEGTAMFDGVFQGKSEADSHGYATALVTIAGDKITEVVLKEVTEAGVFKDYATYPYPVSAQANAELPAKFVEANSAEIDNYTGATSSSEAYKAAVADALTLATK